MDRAKANHHGDSIDNDYEEAEGYIERIIFRNEDNGYTVFVLALDGEEMTCVGTMNYVDQGEYVQLKGYMGKHSIYSDQFEVKSYETMTPETEEAMKLYLASGAIKGIREKTAANIVKHFEKDTFRVIEEEPERLAEIKGISMKKAMEIAVQFTEKKEIRQAMMFLQKYGVSANHAVRIFKKYGNDLYDLIRTNPYQLANDIGGIGFKAADEIAERVGISKDSEYRIRSGVIYMLNTAAASGHVYLPTEVLIQRVSELLYIVPEKIEKQLVDLHLERDIVIKEREFGQTIYSTYYYYLELNSAKCLVDLNSSYQVQAGQVNDFFEMLKQSEKIELDEKQRIAVQGAVENGVMILTGGPGTGKTTTIKAMLHYFEAEGLEILLAAPTGRAAKRIKETTGYEAQTIHRLLEVSSLDERARTRFERNEENPLEADVVIIDEMSMVDIVLFAALVKAIGPGTRLVLVGDVNQLPSVGAGNVLSDMIESKVFHVVKLEKIFRQAYESDIVKNAHRINQGEQIIFDRESQDFVMLRRDNVQVILQSIVYLIVEKLSKHVKAHIYDIQVLTPMRKGELGVEKLNVFLQEHLNPASSEKEEKVYKNGLFREGDKVMQIRNNYQAQWESRSKYGTLEASGTGVYNGDMGVIKQINLYSEVMCVEFEEGRLVEYSFDRLEELELAYAVTIHKSQGSEYPAVVLPLLSGPKMLLNRNLLYTAITRAKACVVMIGSENIVQQMIDNVNENKRYSSLNVMLDEIRR